MAVKAVIMAAGQGTRMKSDLPKVLHGVAGQSMVRWVVQAAQAAGVNEVMVVVGHGADQVRADLPDGVSSCVQSEQLGTGHAVQVAVDALGDVTGDTVLVLSGDTPLLRSEALARLIEDLVTTGSAAALLTSIVEDPSGYGRVLRGADGNVTGIVEQKDASASELAVREINAGVYAFDGARLVTGLADLDNDNAQSEYYLTDVVTQFAGQGLTMVGVPTGIEEVAGVNSHVHLATANAVMRSRIAVGFMEAGAWIQDPASTYISGDTTIEPGARIYAGVHLENGCSIAAGATIGPDVFASDSTFGAGARVWYSVVRGTQVGPNVEVGPYASLRPGTVLEESSKVGTFAETKNTTLGEGAKLPHLSYMGDATIGARANIGAGTITCNYDGVHKHRTEIGDGAFVGCDTMLVAPVRIGDDAVTGAGSTISRDVPDRALGVERAQQKEIPGYADRVDKRRQAKEER